MQLELDGNDFARLRMEADRAQLAGDFENAQILHALVDDAEDAVDARDELSELKKQFEEVQDELAETTRKLDEAKQQITVLKEAIDAEITNAERRLQLLRTAYEKAGCDEGEEVKRTLELVKK